MFEKYFRDELIHRRFRTYKSHLYLAFRYSTGQSLPALTKGRTLDAYCKHLLSLLEEPQFTTQVRYVLAAFDATHKAWIQNGGSPYGIKDNKEFTEMLNRYCLEQFAHDKQVVGVEHNLASQGEILRVNWRNGVWYGFIRRGAAYENVYFDSRAYRDEPRELVPGRKVKFDVVKGDRGVYAKNLIVVS